MYRPCHLLKLFCAKLDILIVCQGLHILHNSLLKHIHFVIDFQLLLLQRFLNEVVDMLMKLLLFFFHIIFCYELVRKHQDREAAFSWENEWQNAYQQVHTNMRLRGKSPKDEITSLEQISKIGSNDFFGAKSELWTATAGYLANSVRYILPGYYFQVSKPQSKIRYMRPYVCKPLFEFLYDLLSHKCVIAVR